MKKYTITVNGTPYDVTVEEADGAESAQSVAPATTPKKVQSVPKPTAASATEGATKIKAPMPGTILDVKVKAGDSVNSGDVLCILEAMKMENEVVAPSAGVVATVSVAKGDSVEADQVIVTIN